MRRMSFMLTKEQVLNQTKDVTRRNGWAFLKPGDLIQPVEKCMGLKKGEKQVLLGGPYALYQSPCSGSTRLAHRIEIGRASLIWSYLNLLKCIAKPIIAKRIKE